MNDKRKAAAKQLNKGYDDGFNGSNASFPNNEDYMSGYRIGTADRQQRQSHLRLMSKNK